MTNMMPSSRNLKGHCAALALALPGSLMAQEHTDLGTLVVTAGGFEQTLRDAPASVTVISSEELENGAFSSLSDALRDVQGVAVTGITAEQDITIRGLPGQYTLILVDGRRQGTRESRPNGNAGYEQSFIPPISTIERIEVVRGPMSSLYGSDAMGGVINIITKKPGQTWSGSVTVEGTAQQHSSYGNSGQLSFNIAGPIVQDRLALQVWGRKMKRGEDDIAEGHQKMEDTAIAGRLSFTPNDDHEFWLESGRTEVEHTGTIGKSVAPGPRAGTTYQDHTRSYWAMGHRGTWGSATTDLSFQKETGERKMTTDGVRQTRIPKVDNSVLDGKLTLPFEWAGQHTLVTGFQYSETELRDDDFSGTTNMDVYQWALFVEDEWRLNDRFAITGGVRYNKHETYGDHWTPRLYGIWTLSDQLTLKGGVSTGFRAPDLRQVSPNYYYPTGRGSGVIPGNPNLKPEKSTSYELAMLWEKSAALNFGITAFYTDFSNKLNTLKTNQIINPSTGAILPAGSGECIGVNAPADAAYRCLYQHINIGKARIKGLELTANAELTSDLRVRGTYTYTDSEQRSGDYRGFPLARTPKHRATLRADWVTPVEGLDTWASATFHGPEVNAGLRIGTNGNPVRGGLGRRYSGYATVDVGGSYTVNDNVRINAAIYNLLDKRTTAAKVNSVNDGRRLWMGVTTQF